MTTLGQQMHDVRRQVNTHSNHEYHGQMAYVENRIERTQQALIEMTRQREQLRVYLLREQEQAEKEPGGRDDIVFTNLLRMPQINDIFFEDDILIVTTHEIVATYKRKKYPLGEFKIAINFPSGNIILTNLTRKSDDFDHPHVFSGSPCYGNIYSEVSRCLINCEVGVLIPLLIQFLETVNEGEWYTHIDHWFVENKTEEENTTNE